MTDDLMDLRMSWFFGSEAQHVTANVGLNTRVVRDVYHLVEFIYTTACGLDIVEICGGDARPSQIAVRRQMPSGENFDLRNGYNLNDKRRQDAVWEYFKRCRPLVAVMAPTCTPFGPMSHLNYQINYDGWLRSYDLAAPHGRFCGRIALFSR